MQTAGFNGDMTTAECHGAEAATQRRELRRVVLLAMDCTAVLAVLIFVGHWVDQRHGGLPFGIATAVFFGLAYNIWKVAKFVRFVSAATIAERSAASRRAADHADSTAPSPAANGSQNVAPPPGTQRRPNGS